MGKLWKLFGAYEVLIVLTIIVTKSDKPSPNAWQNGYELKAKIKCILFWPVWCVDCVNLLTK